MTTGRFASGRPLGLREWCGHPSAISALTISSGALEKREGRLLAAEDPHAIAGYLGMRTDVLIKLYGHHHPEYQESIGDAFSSGRAGRVHRIGNTIVRETGAVSVAVPDVAEIAVPKTSKNWGLDGGRDRD